MKCTLPALLLLASGCGWTASEENTAESNLPLIESIEQDPLLLTYERTDLEEEVLQLHFLAEHQNDTSLTLEDYTFQQPAHISSEAGSSYEVLDTDVFEEDFLGEPLEESELGITITAEPPEIESEDPRFRVPFHITANLYSAGYRFSLEDGSVLDISMGDLHLSEISAEGSQLTFLMEDEHPEADEKRIQYSFVQRLEGENVYPLFQRVEQQEEHAEVRLEYAQDLSSSASFQIQRRNASVPEWHFSLVVPLE